jgi:DNA-binding CsgD family transcriptional regulator/tetratricopeptide (TPR) repeat protein
MELLERDAHLDGLRACVEGAARGAGCAALVAGEAGIGKTSLVRALTREFPDLPAWWGSCDALETPNPLGPLRDIARSADARFRAALNEPMRPVELFGQVLEELQAMGPALLVIEDAHWADESTLDFVRYVGRRIDRTRAVLVVTFRDDEMSSAHALRKVIGDLPASLTTRIDLPRLSKAAVAKIARRALRAPGRLHETTGGNPFFLTELLRDGSAEVPRSVQDLVLARYARLPHAARDIVQLASIVPARTERWLVEELLAPGASDIQACLDSGLVVADEDSIAFRHEIARVAVEKAISTPLVQWLHTQALDALVRRGVQADNAARLVHPATPAGARDEVLAFAPVAARQARERGARREAAAHYRTALRYAEALPTADHFWLLESYAVECRATHQLDEAIAARERISRLMRAAGNPLAEGRNLSQLAIDLVVALKNADADASSRRAIEILEALPPGPELANAYQVEAQLRMLNRECEASVRWGEKAIALAKRHGDVPVLAAAYGSVGAALLFIDYDAGVARVREALELALEHGLDYVAANGYSNLGSASGEIFRLREAEEHLQSAIRFATLREIEVYRAYALSWLALCHVFLGRWDEAEAHAEEALSAAPAVSTARVMALCALGRFRVRRGEADPEALLDKAKELALATGTLQRIAPMRAARAEAACLRGDPAAMAEEASAGLDLARRHRHPWYVGELSYWLWRAGLAGAPLEECAEPYALLMSGRVREAAECWARIDAPYEQARALAHGDEAAQVEAVAMFERMGARPCAEVLRRSLREAGVRGVPRGPRPSTQRNPRGLTSREMEILELLCLGLKNSEIAERLFRSVRTIEHHVDSILGKLDAKSRSEVAAIASREGLAAPKLGRVPTQYP